MINTPPNHEKEEVDSNYDEWQKAMQDVEFHSNKTTNTSESEKPESRKPISKIIQTISQSEMEYSGEYLLRPRVEIICDRDHIEDQRIDIINKRDQGLLEFRFKLRKPTEAIATMITQLENNDEEATTPSGLSVKKGPFIYGISGSEPLVLCDAFIFEKNGIKVSIADPASLNGQPIEDGIVMHSAIGLIKIETPLDMSSKDTEKSLNEIFEEDLGIPDALSEVPIDSEKEYKIARYKWQHTITEELTPEQIEETENLERQEVFPGYTTFVEKGRHKEYIAKYGEDLRIIHQLHSITSAQSIYRALTQGLMSTSERFSRGIMREGSSISQDLATGGADSVFTRVFTKKQREAIGKMRTTIVFKPELFDRTDWYTYSRDVYGATIEPQFSHRISPDTLLSACLNNQDNEYLLENEQMFRKGIGPSYIDLIEVDETKRDTIIAELKTMGLAEVDGRPIEEIIVARKITQPVSISESTTKPTPEPKTTKSTSFFHHSKSKIKKPNAKKSLSSIIKLPWKKN